MIDWRFYCFICHKVVDQAGYLALNLSCCDKPMRSCVEVRSINGGENPPHANCDACDGRFNCLSGNLDDYREVAWREYLDKLQILPDNSE